MKYLHGYARVKEYRKNIKKRLILGFGGKCGRCGYNKCDRALEFHHIDPREKDFAISSKIASWKKLTSECKKCVLICSNCHMELHSNLWKIDNSIPRFNEKLCPLAEK